VKPSIAARLGRGTVLLDGGMGSALITRGLDSGEGLERWNLERPDVVRDVHAAYLTAGSEVIQTNTFRGNAFALAAHGLAAEMERINRAGARIAREAVERISSERWVAGNIGPSGRFLPPVGDASPMELEDVFAAQAAALDSGGVDYLSIETMPHLEEALCALRGALRATDLPVTVCLTFDRKKRGFFTIMGVDVPTAVAIFPGELYQPPRAWVQRQFNLQRWTEMPRGGHFAALEAPQLLAEDVRAFVRSLR